MIQVCAWCDSKIRETAKSQHGISHGICSNCSDNIRFQEGVPLDEFVNSLPEPVYVVDDDVVIKGVNRMGCAVLNKGSHEIIQQLGGDVFECAYARLPGGCGRTIHCSGCAIRRAVTKTFHTGQVQSRVPVMLNLGDESNSSVVNLTITTIKSQDFVFLRINEMNHEGCSPSC